MHDEMAAAIEAKRLFEAERLLAHVRTADTRWFKASGWLLDIGLHKVPEGESSRNPIKWLIAEVGYRMADAQTRAVNRRMDAKFGPS